MQNVYNNSIFPKIIQFAWNPYVDSQFLCKKNLRIFYVSFSEIWDLTIHKENGSNNYGEFASNYHGDNHF